MKLKQSKLKEKGNNLNEIKRIIVLSLVVLTSITTYAQDGTVNFKLEKTDLSKFFESIEKQSAYKFSYLDIDIQGKEKVSISGNKQQIKSVLAEVLTIRNLQYQVMGNKILVTIKKKKQEAQQKTKNVTGTVFDSNNETVIGANIILKGTTSVGTITDIDGRFSLKVPEDAVLQISYIGYNTQNILVAGKTSLGIIKLHENEQTLDELVVVGYGMQKKANLSGAVGAASGKILENRPVTNVGQALQGAIGNLNISSSSGQANSTPKFNIRGETSITGGEPLILVDNVPITADEFSRINAQDIDNISVLKDASSAAIYGARASFGVILVTTKRGEGERISINYSGNISMNSLTNLPDLVMDPYTVANWKNIAGQGFYNFFDAESITYAKKRSEDPSLPVAFLSAAKPEIWQYFGSTNWFDEAYKKISASHNHSLNISGSTDKVKYYISGDFYNNNGALTIGSDKYNRYNFRTKLDYNITSWLDVGTNIAYTYYTNDQPYNFYSSDIDDKSTMFFHNLSRTSTLDVPKNEDGSWTDRGAGIMGRLADGGRSVTKSGNFQGTFSLGLNLIKDILSIKANATFKKKNINNHNWDVPISAKKGPNLDSSLTSHDPFTTNPFSNRYGIEENYTVYDIFANFQKTIAQSHEVSAVVGFNQEEFCYTYFGAGRDMLISNSLPSYQLATGTMSMSEKIESWALRGVFYRLNYSYENKYIIETNGRYDGSSRFPSNDRFGFFPSVSAAWIMSEETIFEPLRDVVDFLKVRGSYGALGNQSVGAYEYIPNMSAETLDILLDGETLVGVNPPGLVSPSLTWERVKTINGGFDLNVLSNRLTLGVDVYRRDTEGMLSKGQTLPNVLGTEVPKENAADLRVNGWEISLGWRDALQLGEKPFNYSAGFILSDNHATITKFSNPTNSLDDKDDQYYVGQKLGEIWGLTTLGFFQSKEEIENHADQTKVMAYPNSSPIEPGDLKFADLDGDGEVSNGEWTLDDHGDYKIIGNTTPRYNFGLDLYADWNNFDLRAFFQGVGKQDWYPNAGNHYYWGMYAQPWTNVLKSNMDHWSVDNPNATYPRPKSYIAESEKELGAPQTKYLQSAAYCRLKNLTVGYTIPEAILSKIKIQNLRIYFSGENLFTIKSLPKQINPEGLSGSVYPYQRTFSFGLNLSL